ncbi:glucuronate isomerase [Microbacterium sp. A82]|uniref:glucuronate isomerase n=1 Tax=Microbacterium sp. A82 TaxID=3450452 RepID=UPI003F3E6AD5
MTRPVPPPRAWNLHPDRALPAEPSVRSAAREILAQTSALPILSMHGHVESALLAADAPFENPAALFVTPDHYLLRMLVAQSTSPDGSPGVRGVQSLGVPPANRAPSGVEAAEQSPREIWRRFCAGWHLFRGTPTRYWLEHVLIEVFEVAERPSAASADRIYDHLMERLRAPEFRPRALFELFGIETLATTDPAESSLSHHAQLAAQGWADRVIPTFRPDSLLHVSSSDWAERILSLGASAHIDVHDYRTYLEALRAQRQSFIAAGARATDHGHMSADTTPLDPAEASRIFTAALRGQTTPAQSRAFAAHMLFEMAAMSVDDGLTMQVHPGVQRDHSSSAMSRYGHDIGYDIPVPTDYVHGLRPVLDAFGHHPNFRMIAFTVDETTFSRELAPLAGVYPALRLGAPWWFLDSPDGMRRFREAITDTAGFYNTSGFVDDTRAFCSIPARHDLARRIDAGYLGRLVCEHRLDIDEAIETAADLAYHLPKKAYPRPSSAPKHSSPTASDHLERTPA